MKRSFARTRRPLPAQRGYVLLITLALIVLMTVAAAAVYQQSESRRVYLSSMKGQALAQTRAKWGVQRTFARLQTDNALMQQVLALPAVPSFDIALAQSQVVEWVEQGNANTPLDQGGGLLFRSMIYRRSSDAPDKNMFVMVSTGFYGSAEAQRAFERALQSRVEIEFTAANFGTAITTPAAMF